jgi:nucleoid-associated protein YgaU
VADSAKRILASAVIVTAGLAIALIFRKPPQEKVVPSPWSPGFTEVAPPGPVANQTAASDLVQPRLAGKIEALVEPAAPTLLPARGEEAPRPAFFNSPPATSFAANTNESAATELSKLPAMMPPPSTEMQPARVAVATPIIKRETEQLLPRTPLDATATANLKPLIPEKAPVEKTSTPSLFAAVPALPPLPALPSNPAPTQNNPLKLELLGTGNSPQTSVNNPPAVVLPALDQSSTTAAAQNLAMPMNGQRSHKIVDGDTLENIAQRYYGDVRRVNDIMAANQQWIRNPEMLPIGYELQLPGASLSNASPATSTWLKPPTMDNFIPRTLAIPENQRPATSATDPFQINQTQPSAVPAGWPGATATENNSQQAALNAAGWPQQVLNNIEQQQKPSWPNRIWGDTKESLTWVGNKVMGTQVSSNTSNQRTYLVRPLETWEVLAARFYGDANAAGKLQTANSQLSGQSLRPGMVLVIP